MNVAIYARYSSDSQREESIDAQIRAIQEYCKKNNYIITKIYTDEARSATTDNRPQFLKLIEESKLGLFDSVIVHKLDRFSRNRYDSAFYKKKLKENRVRLLSVLENLDDSPESIILESVLEGMAEYYSQNLKREVMKGMRETALQGKHNGGPPPLGLEVTKDKTYIINEQEAEAVRIIFKRFISGLGYSRIADELNSLGYKMKSGKSFRKNSVREILMNEKYTGTYVFNRRADGKTLAKLKSDDEIIRVYNCFPAIISMEDFDRAKLKFTNTKTGKRVRKMNYILTGKLFCGECNKHYTGAGHTKGRDRTSDSPTLYYKYACTGRNTGCENKPVNKNNIENIVIEHIKENILNDIKIPEIAEELCNLIMSSKNNNQLKLKEYESEINKLKSQIDKDFQLYYDDLLDKDLLSERINSKKQKLSLIENEVIILKSKNYFPDKNKIMDYLNTQKILIETEDLELQQKVINTFVQCVIIYNDKIDINLGIDDLTTNMDSDKGYGSEPHITLSLSIPKNLLLKKQLNHLPQ